MQERTKKARSTSKCHDQHSQTYKCEEDKRDILASKCYAHRKQSLNVKDARKTTSKIHILTIPKM